MRILASRHYWHPRTRIAGLVRYAFIGDSNVFGQGVDEREAFPARAGQLMNEAAGAPIEAVNLGVNGYNIWNSWLSFKQMPQVYDGVVFTLCNNDAQFFGRTFAVDYRNSDPLLWQESHPFRPAIVYCFDDIAQFARTVPLLVCYCNLWAGKAFEDIAATMRTLCEERGLPFVDFYAHFRERRIAQTELIVSDADHHPSALAHDAAARHLVQHLRKANWFKSAVAGDLETAPDAILAAAAELVAQDAYPIDAALGWAAMALDGKRRLALRLEASQPIGEFSARAEQAFLKIETARQLWQTEARAAAAVEQLATSDRGVPGALNHVEEEILRLEELDHALDKGGWSHIAADLLKSLPDRRDEDAANGLAGVRTRAAAIRNDLERFPQALSLLREAHATPWLPSRNDAARYIADLDDAAALAEETLDRLRRFDAALARVETRLAANTDSAADTQLVMSVLARRSVTMSMERFERIHGALLGIFAPARTVDRPETTIEISVRTNRVEGRHPCLVEVIANYGAPRRLAMRESRYFLPDGAPKNLTMRLPLLYSGRLLISLRLPPAVADRIDAAVEEVRLTNAAGGRRTLVRDEFVTDSLGRLASPQFWLV